MNLFKEKRYPDLKSSILLFFLHVIIIFGVTFVFSMIVGISLGAGGAATENAELQKQIETIIKNNQVILSMVAVAVSAVVLTLITIRTRGVSFKKFLLKNTDVFNWKLAGLVIVSAVSISVFIGDISKFIFDTSKYMPKYVEAFQGNTVIIFALLFAPIFEEIIFRGIILDGLLSNHSVPLAFIVSSLLFSISHGTLVQLLPTFLIGLFFAFIYYKTYSLILTMFAHFIYNIFPVINLQFIDAENLADQGDNRTLIIIISVIVFTAGIVGLKFYFGKNRKK